jgi:hypothetical protein
MKAVLRYLGATVKRAVTAGADLYRRYPARGNSYILAGLVAAGTAAGIAVNPQSAGTIIAIVAPILLGGEATHHLVSPTAKTQQRSRK